MVYKFRCAPLDGDGFVCQELGGRLAGRETDLPQAAERQLICSGEKWGGGGPCLSFVWRRLGSFPACLSTWGWATPLSGSVASENSQ